MPGTDRQLLARISSGSDASAREALAELYRRHGGSVLRFLKQVLPDPNDAEDVLQETFLAAARHAGRAAGDDARPWLTAIAANRVRDLHRGRNRRKRREREASQRPAEASSPAADEPGARLESALALLGERDRAVIELKHIQGLEHSEVAQVLGISLRTAKTWSAAALTALRARLEAES